MVLIRYEEFPVLRINVRPTHELSTLPNLLYINNTYLSRGFCMSQNDYSAQLDTAIKYLEINNANEVAELLKEAVIVGVDRPMSFSDPIDLRIKLQVPLEKYDIFKSGQIEGFLYQAFLVAFSDYSYEAFDIVFIPNTIPLQKARAATPAIPEDEKQYRCDVFMIMPFRPQLTDKIYVPLIKPLIEEDLGLSLRRGDNPQNFSEVIVHRVLKYISNSEIVIADLTLVDGEVNGNVYYELGYADAQKRNIILISQKNSKPFPFDIGHRDIIHYEDSASGGAALTKKLKHQIQEYRKGK
jgi:hypothetical protein